MLGLDDAIDHVLSVCTRRPAMTTPIAGALGLVLAQDVVAGDDIPPFANTAMDGFAVQAASTASPPVTLEVVETIAAGHVPTREVGAGQASRIMTGGVIPPGADAVVMVERTTENEAAGTVTVDVEVPVGNHIRPAGDDIGANTLVFTEGTVLGAGHLGVLASLGATHVCVFPRMRVGVMSTGDELVDDASDLRPGQIRDSNRVMLLNLLEANGIAPLDIGLVRDDEAALERAIRHAATYCDALVSSGGVSMGDFDFVKSVLRRIGDMRWMQVAIKPAKPFAFGTVDDMVVFGLPGNPVSSLVSFELFARTGLRNMMGFRPPRRAAVSAVADADLARHPDGKTHFMRVVAELPPAGSPGPIRVRSAGGQGSHMLWAMANANALAVVGDGEGVAAGEPVDVLLLEAFA